MTPESNFLHRRPRPGALAWLLPLVLLVGCSSGSGSSTSVSVEGQWEGTWTTNEPLASGQVTLTLTQEGPTVDGVIELVGFACIELGHVTCTMKGPKMSGWCEQAQTRLRLHGKCHGHHDEVLDLSFELTEGPCAGEHGTLHLTRVGAPGAPGPGSGALVPVGHGLLLEPDQDAPYAVTVWGRAATRRDGLGR